MRFPFRAIAAGILVGALLFFFPFFFRFIFIVLLVALIIRLFIGRRWFDHHHGYRGYGSYSRRAYENDFEDDIVPIDGNRFHSSIGKKGPSLHFNVR